MSPPRLRSKRLGIIGIREGHTLVVLTNELDLDVLQGLFDILANKATADAVARDVEGSLDVVVVPG